MCKHVKNPPAFFTLLHLLGIYLKNYLEVPEGASKILGKCTSIDFLIFVALGMSSYLIKANQGSKKAHESSRFLPPISLNVVMTYGAPNVWQALNSFGVWTMTSDTIPILGAQKGNSFCQAVDGHTCSKKFKQIYSFFWRIKLCT